MTLRPYHNHVLVALIAALPDTGDSRSVEYKTARVKAVGHQSHFEPGQIVALDPDQRPVAAGTEKNEQGEAVQLAFVPLEAILGTLEGLPPKA